MKLLTLKTNKGMKRVDFGTRDYSYPTPKEPKKKVFTSTKMADIFYEVQDEYWLDDETYVIIFQDMVDADGDEFHLEVEYHKDEERVTYTRVYEYENVEASDLVSPCFKKPIEEYILQKAEVISEDEFIITKEIGVELKLAVPKAMSVGEFQEWLKESSIEVNRLVATDKQKLINKVKVLEIHNKGSK